MPASRAIRREKDITVEVVFMSVEERPTGVHKCACYLGTLMLVCSAASACAQGDVLQSINGSSQGQQFVSTNQLLTPQKAKQATDRACLDIIHGRLESAQQELRRALDVAPHYAVALTTQGAVDLQVGNIDRATKAFQQAVEDDPTLGAAYVGVGVVLIAQGKFKEALTPLNRATSLLPGSWYVHLESGLAHLGLGNTDTALQEADLAERFAGPDREKRSGAAYLHALTYAVMSNSDRAKKYFAETITRDPNGFYASLAKRGADKLQPTVTGWK